MNNQLSLIRANAITDTLPVNNLLSASSLLLAAPASAITSKSKSEKTNATAPTEGAKRGRRPLPRDANEKIIRPTIVANNANSENKGQLNISLVESNMQYIDKKEKRILLTK